MSAVRKRRRGIQRIGPAGDLSAVGDSLVWIDAARGSVDVEAAAGRLLEPGLWRPTRIDDRIVNGFECPGFAWLARFCGGDDAWLQDSTRLETEVEAWARATAAGCLPKGWVSPDSEEVSTWLSDGLSDGLSGGPPDGTSKGLAAGRLSVRAGPHVAKGELECAEDRLRLCFPQVVRFDETVSPARHAWLRALCLDTQLHWQLVRFGVADDCVRAEVDLSGVPRELALPLFRVAAEALAFCVRWVLPACALIVDPSTKSEALDRGPWWTRAETAVTG